MGPLFDSDICAIHCKFPLLGGCADPNPAQNHDFMFGRSVEDPDGNVWEIMWMDAAAHTQTPESA